MQAEIILTEKRNLKEYLSRIKDKGRPKVPSLTTSHSKIKAWLREIIRIKPLKEARQVNLRIKEIKELETLNNIIINTECLQ
jgi:hypothetical protein